MNFVPNIDVARKEVETKVFSTYSAAYILTNENLEKSVQFMPKKCNRALVVAASGDHPLFCSVRGAKQVDTFDISYNAKCIMDIKTAALKCLKYSDYRYLLRDLWQTDDVMMVAGMYKVSKFLPSVEWEYLCSMSGHALFSKGAWNFKKELMFPNEQEYQKLQNTVTKPYNFIMSDIDNLSNCLTESYDFMHLSNIFDYKYTMSSRLSALYPLLKHVNVGGRIVIQHIINIPWDNISLSQYFRLQIEKNKNLELLNQELINQHKPCFDNDFIEMIDNQMNYLRNMYDGGFKNWDYKKYDNGVIVFERIR
jgi:hypothetical protein